MVSVNPYRFSPDDVLVQCPKILEDKYSTPSVIVLFTSTDSKKNSKMPSWTQTRTFFIGIFAGFFISFLIKKSIFGSFSFCIRTENNVRIVEDPFDIVGADRGMFPHNSDKNLVFIGVMTAQQYLDTRAVAAYETYAKQIPGKIAFFTSESSVTSSNIPVVRLKGVDDTYPPQKKSFMMIKYMHDHFLNHFEFFMRADDDVFIRPDLLENFLRSVNSSKHQFIGQAGRGNSEEFGRLSLLDYENFCMGGPGVILSQATLAVVAPHVGDCLRNVHTTHEDVELGRCVQRYAGVSCTWSYEMQRILYHDRSQDSFGGKLKQPELHRAITLHPVKNHTFMYRLHHYFQTLQVVSLETKLLQLVRELGALHRNTAAASHPLRLPNLDDARHGVFLSHLGREASLQAGAGRHETTVQAYQLVSKLLFSLDTANPKQRLPSYFNESLADVIAYTMHTINLASSKRGRELEYRNLLYSYVRHAPGTGMQLVLDLLLLYKRFRGNKMTIPVRRHGYFQVPFGPLYVRELPVPTKDVAVDHIPQPAAVVHFLLPLAGRIETLTRFLANYERVVLMQHERATLTIILYREEQRRSDTPSLDHGQAATDAESDVQSRVRRLTLKYPAALISIVHGEGEFQRAQALQLGAQQWPAQDALLFCVDVDMSFTSDLLPRLRLHTKLNAQVYFPIVFSEFDPSVAGAPPHDERGHTVVTEESGYFRSFGFGIMSVYQSDLMAVGGFNTSIRGWGGEDVDLYEKFVASKNLRVFRSSEPALVHVYHPPACDYRPVKDNSASNESPSLSDDRLKKTALSAGTQESQWSMCAGSVYSTHASKRVLSRRLLDDPSVLRYFAARRRPLT
ncbi:chondroitin sulfate synthase 1 [Hyalella azteca]|uniref:Hexosyltransferase n=1 Tax=Hyalella azteca TaxID=294128 RepID=A0A8B7PK52_HYAAZ|nr:chondroitin sulfate synthase 1 [Hyalella azteca]